MQKDLIIALKSGNQDAFKECVETFQEKVLNTCYHFLHDRLDAEDISQEVFLEVHRSIKYFREEAQLSTWVYRIAVNKSLDFLRKRNRKKRFANIISLFSVKGHETDILIKDRRTPLSNIEQKERIRILDQAIDRLPENQKIVIVLRRFEGLSNKEIAYIMDTSVSAVDSLFHRAKTKLYNNLYKYFEKKL